MLSHTVIYKKNARKYFVMSDFLQGKGEMETHWLIGVRNSNEDLTNYNNNNNNSGNKNNTRKQRISWETNHYTVRRTKYF